MNALRIIAFMSEIKPKNLDIAGTEYAFRYDSDDTVKIKKDIFFREREKTAEMWDICCQACGSKVLLYQKDGRGKLHRCYLNRILDPPYYANLQDSAIENSKKGMPVLKCHNCNEILGYPMLHREGRLAFFLLQGKWKYKKSKVKGN